MGQPLGILPPGFTWATTGPIGGQQGQIFIRGPHPEGMFFQTAPQQTITAQQGNYIANISVLSWCQ